MKPELPTCAKCKKPVRILETYWNGNSRRFVVICHGEKQIIAPEQDVAFVKRAG